MSVPSGMETAAVMQASCLLILNRPLGVSKVCLQQARVSGAMYPLKFLTFFPNRTLLTAYKGVYITTDTKKITL
jgi:hypothetical protein